MYIGKHSVPRKWHMNKMAAMALAIVMVVLAAAGVTLAVLSQQSGTVQNTFSAATSDITIDEVVKGDVKQSVTVHNKGTSPVYVRVAVVINCLDKEGNIIPGKVPEFVLNDTNWTKLEDGYYYYKGILASGESTADLLKAPFNLTGKNGENYQMDVLAQAIQAGGTTSDGVPAVQDAWGATYENGNWQLVP